MKVNPLTLNNFIYFTRLAWELTQEWALQKGKQTKVSIFLGLLICAWGGNGSTQIPAHAPEHEIPRTNLRSLLWSVSFFYDTRTWWISVLSACKFVRESTCSFYFLSQSTHWAVFSIQTGERKPVLGCTYLLYYARLFYNIN